jgi:cytochrome P450
MTFISALLLAPVVGAVSLIAYLVLSAIYNVFFHPLRNQPGPKLYAASRITWSLDFISGKSQYRLNELHKKYGDVVRIGPNELSYVNPQVWKEVYASRIGGQMQKDPDHYTKHDKTPELHVSGDEDHTRMRRLISHAFSDKALRDQEYIMQSYYDLLMQRLHEVASTGRSVDVKQWIAWALFDLFGDLCVGEPFGCLREKKGHPWCDIITDAVQAFGYIGLILRIPGIKTLMNMPGAFAVAKLVLPAKRLEQAAWHTQFSTDMADKRIAMKTDRPDFMSFILKANDEKGLTVPEIRANTNVLILGGSDTSTTFLNGSIWYLCKNPSKYKLLTDEIREAFKTNEDITLTNTIQLKYLNAVIEEGLRIYPPVPGNNPRLIPKGGATILGEHLPEGTSVSIAHFPMFHNPGNFKDPGDYVPERWLGDPRYASDNKQAHQPFSYGPRNCIGKSLAWGEMRLALAKFFWNFDVTLEPESENWYPHPMMVIWNSPKLNVKLHPVIR